MKLPIAFDLLLCLSTAALADGLYSKTSPVLQVDAKTYKSLIEKSNYTSLVEFYAPWCGHCKNLKPDYEKVAKSLAGAAKVAAINCDDDANKGFCGSMGVQGFPTLKIIKPKKKGGKPVVSDYMGERSAKAMKDALEDKIPNHVTKLTDKTLDEWLAKGDRPKAVFMTEKAVISPMVKGIAIDFLGVMDVAQARSTEKNVAAKFMVNSFPAAFFLATGQHVPEQYQGELRKDSLVAFFTGTGIVTPNPEWPAAGAKSKSRSPKPKSIKKEAGPGEPTRVKKPKAASEILQDHGPPTPSPGPKVESEKPIEVPIDNQPVEDDNQVRILEEEGQLREACLTTKSTTCVLALMSEEASSEANALKGVSFIRDVERIARKSKGRRKFPIFGIPFTNKLGGGLLSSLGLKTTSPISTVVAINAKRGWWAQFEEDDLNMNKLENWFDSLRLGDFKKQRLPAVDLVDAVEKPITTSRQPGVEEAEPSIEEAKADHDEL